MLIGLSWRNLVGGKWGVSASTKYGVQRGLDNRAHVILL